MAGIPPIFYRDTVLETAIQVNNHTLRRLLDTTIAHHQAIHGRTPMYQGQNREWTEIHVGKAYFYERLVTFAGSTMTVDLNVPFAFRLNRVEQVFLDSTGLVLDATSRDDDVRVYTDPAIPAYVELKNSTGDTATNRYLQLGIEYNYPASSRIQIAYANYTVTKTVRIKIQLEEL